MDLCSIRNNNKASIIQFIPQHLAKKCYNCFTSPKYSPDKKRMEHKFLKESKTFKEKIHEKLYYISLFHLVLCIHFSGTQPWPQSNPYSIMQLQHPTCCVYIFFLQFRYYFGWLHMFPLFCVSKAVGELRMTGGSCSVWNE